MIPGRVYSARDLAAIVRQRKWALVLPFVLVVTATAVVSKYLPDRYRSETLILVVPQRIPEAYVRSTVITRIEDRLPAITQQILSRTRLERIVQDFGLYGNVSANRTMEDVVATMRSEIRVEIVEGDAFRVSYEANDPTIAMKATDRLAALFIEENLKDRAVLAKGTSSFLRASSKMLDIAWWSTRKVLNSIDATMPANCRRSSIPTCRSSRTRKFSCSCWLILLTAIAIDACSWIAPSPISQRRSTSGRPPLQLLISVTATVC